MDKAAPQKSTSTDTAETYETSSGKSRTTPILLGILILIVLAGAGWYFYSSQQKAAPTKEPEVAATVNGEKILKSDYDSIYNAQLYYFNNLYKTEVGEDPSKELIELLPNVVLDNLIEEVLLKQSLGKKGIKIDDTAVRQKIQKEVVDPKYKGDWQAYETQLKEKYKSNLANISRTFRVGLMIEKIIEAEKLSAEEFNTWYSDLKSKAEIEIKLSNYKKKS